MTLDELEPELAGVALNLRRVLLDQSELFCAIDADKNVSKFVVGEVANAFEFLDVLDAGAGGQIDKSFDGHYVDEAFTF